MKTRLLHISQETPFIYRIITSFEDASPGVSDYFIFTDNVKEPVKGEQNIYYYPLSYYADNNLINQINSYRAVLFNSLSYEHQKLINKCSKDIKLLWFMWGADGLYLDKLRQKWYTSSTKTLLKKLQTKSYKRKLYSLFKKTLFYEWYYIIRKGYITIEKERLLAIKRINYIAPVIEDDYLIIKKYVKNIGECIPFSIGSVEKVWDKWKVPINSGKNENSILLGNSADPSNNHIDILMSLSKYNFKGKIVCPLSYGKENYKKKIIEIGTNLFKSNFYPLVDFIPLEEYQKTLNSCSVIIMNHLRQQGMGNIFTGLWQGKKVFLNDLNYTKKYLENLDLKIYSAQKDLEQTIINGKFEEDENVINNNKKQLMKFYSHKANVNRTQYLISKLH